MDKDTKNEQQNTQLTLLNDSIIILVCSFLDPYSLFQFSSVCTLFRRLSRVPVLKCMRSPALSTVFRDLVVLKRSLVVSKDAIPCSQACAELVSTMLSKQDPLVPLATKIKNPWRPKSKVTMFESKAKKKTKKEEKRAKEIDKQITAQLKQDGLRLIYGERQRYLLLGLPNSGKTTWLKQMEILYGTNEPEKLLTLPPAQALRQHVLDTMILYLKRLNVVDEQFQSLIKTLTEATEWTESLMDTILSFWHNEYLRPLFENNSLMPLLNIERYLDNPHILANSQFIPTTEDILNAKSPTKPGILKTVVEIHGNSFTFCEVNFQNSEKRRLLPFLQDATYYFYFVSLEGYDIPLVENPQMTQLEEALRVWEELYQSKYLSHMCPILFFTKADILTEKIQKNPPTQSLPFFAELSDPDITYDKVIQHTIDRFLKNYTPININRAYTHVLCCKDTELCARVMTSVTDMLFFWNMDFIF